MQLSKKQVNQAGDNLRLNSSDDQALDTLAKWRSLHTYPLKLAFNLLKRKTDKIGNNATYGQRLKRVSSIVSKLKRMPKAQLSRLQDIGGCRVILSNYDKLRQLYSDLQKSRSTLLGHKDYITYPKSDGYRSIHLIYTCNTKQEQSSGLKIELQLRTRLQHAWATAVEIIDSFEGEDLKQGGGSKDWKRFFYLVADEFAKLEKLPIHDNSMQTDRLEEIKQLSIKLNVFDKLEGYAVAVARTTDKNLKVGDYFVLSLDTEKKHVEILSFVSALDAQIAYITLEKGYLNNPRVNILLAESSSIKTLKQAYPNYFADSKVFLGTLSTVFNIAKVYP